MALPTSVREFCSLLAKSKLLPAEDVEGIARRWKEETKGKDEQIEAFCKYLIAKKTLTEWQAAMLRRGRADGFFVANYRILDRIGKGQMGGVYKAVHGLGQIVALKILPSSKAKNQHVLGRFQREARLLTQLDHPNVVRAYQVGEGGGINYIAMEYLEGETLDEILNRRKRLPWGEAARLIHQALGGLQHLYERRMIHRDIKPANMMLTPAPEKGEATWNATVKILDIGLGRELFDEDTPEGKIETQLTVEGSVLGTPDYLAPEQAKDARSADIRADVYSVGCVLFHCICGQPPFPETNIMSQMLKHATERPPPLNSIVSDVPPGLQTALDKMLAKSPDERFATPAAAADALKPYLGAKGASPSKVPIVPAFQEWLVTESHLEMPKPVPQPQTAAAKPTQSGNAAKPGTGPSPALGTPASVRDSGTVRPPSARTAAAGPVRPVPVPVAPARPPSSQKIRVDEVDVELVTEPFPSPNPLVEHLTTLNRPLWDFDRRDWIMLASGATGVLAAVGVGYGLARLFRKKPEEPLPGSEE